MFFLSILTLYLYTQLFHPVSIWNLFLWTDFLLLLFSLTEYFVESNLGFVNLCINIWRLWLHSSLCDGFTWRTSSHDYSWRLLLIRRDRLFFLGRRFSIRVWCIFFWCKNLSLFLLLIFLCHNFWCVLKEIIKVTFTDLISFNKLAM